MAVATPGNHCVAFGYAGGLSSMFVEGVDYVGAKGIGPKDGVPDEYARFGINRVCSLVGTITDAEYVADPDTPNVTLRGLGRYVDMKVPMSPTLTPAAFTVKAWCDKKTVKMHWSGWCYFNIAITNAATGEVLWSQENVTLPALDLVIDGVTQQKSTYVP